MMCKMVKKGVLGAALGAGALALLFGTAAPSYFWTGVERVQTAAKSKVSIPFDIERARRDVAQLDEPYKETIAVVANLEEDVKTLEGEIAAHRANLGQEQAEMAALRNSLVSGDYRLTGGGSAYTARDLKVDLARRIDQYKDSERVLAEKETTLKHKKQAVRAAMAQLNTIKSQRQTLLVQIDEVEAKFKALESSRQLNEFNFDTSALARAKKTVAELKRRLNVEARKADLEGRFADKQVTVNLDADRDVVKEFDSKFGSVAPAPADKSADKDL